MKLASFRTGRHLTLNDVPFKIERIIENGDCYLEKLSNGSISAYSMERLVDAYTSGKLQLSGEMIDVEYQNRYERDLSSLDKVKQKQVLRKFYYVKRANSLLEGNETLDCLPNVIETVSEEIEDQTPPSASTLYRWWKAWLDSDKNIMSLLNKSPGRNRRSRKYGGRVQLEVNSVIENIYLTRQKMTIQSAYDALVFRLKELNLIKLNPLAIPNRSTFYRIINKINKHEVMAAREGKRVADKYFRATGAGADPKHILERVEVDHTPLDLIVINENTGLAEGRPTLTLLLDRYSRIPLGFEVGFEPPSELSVIRALRKSILPKNNVKDSYPNIENDWPAYGTPIVLVCDNGLEFHANQLRRMCAELNIELLFCPKQQPHYKGAVERFLGTLNRQVCHRLAGTTFSNIEHRGEYDSVKESKVTLKQVEELIHEWIIDIYSQQIHKMTLKTPYSMWKKGLSIVEPIIPSCIDDLDLILTREEERNLTHQGVQLHNLYYNNSELGLMRTLYKNTEKVKVRYDPEDLGCVWVFDEENQNYIKVECISADYANGLTRRQHKLILQEVKSEGKNTEDTNTLLFNKERFRKKLENLSNDKLLKERKKAARDIFPAINNVQKSKKAKYYNEKWDLSSVPEFETSNKRNNN